MFMQYFLKASQHHQHLALLQSFTGGKKLVVAILIRFPNAQSGTASSPKIAIIIPKIPNGNAGPSAMTQSEMKYVQAKAMTDRTMVVITKQLPCRGW